MYHELLQGLAWARDPRGRPLDDAAWTAYQADHAVGRDLHDAVDWAYHTLRDAGPPPPWTRRETQVLNELAGRHPRLFPDGPAAPRWGGGGPADPDIWRWIGAAVPDALRAIGAEAGIDRDRIAGDLAAAIVGAPPRA